MQCGLLGRKLGHSYSPQIHKFLGNYTYDLIECEPEDLESFFKENSCAGLNVTIPYKKDVLPFCDELTQTAQLLGSVNTIIRTEDGRRIGHNTDYFGFSSMLHRSGLQVAGKKVLVLGSGGASVTVCAVLKNEGANIVVISRSGKDNYENLIKHKDASVIVNTTPVGMFPNNGESPLSLDHFPDLEGVLDLIYNPSRTKLILDAQSRGLVACNGLWMLVAQAKESAQWFTGTSISNTVIETIHSKLSAQMKNIILVGMPGCGKSTIGQQLAQASGRQFIDADEAIVNDAGIGIPEIFEQYGEKGFRRIETRVLLQLGKLSGTVIATGGGCVTRPENYELLHQNGTIYFIKRDTKDLPMDGRPLSLSGDLQKMYEVRLPLYRAFADAEISNDKGIGDAVDMILKLEETV